MTDTAVTPKIRPLDDRVVISVNAAEEVTGFGLVIPANAQERPQTGIVLEVGPGRTEYGMLIPPDMAPGDTVVFSKFGGTELTIDGISVLILSARDVLAVLP